MKSGITKVQKQTLDAIKHFIETEGHAPSFQDIADSFYTDYTTRGRAYKVVQDLKQRGHLTITEGKARSIAII